MRQKLISGVFVVFLLTSANIAAAATSETYRQLNLFGDIFERVRADYVEQIDESELIEAAINGMLQSLDPHSSYLNPKTFRAMQVQTRGEFGGLGIEVTMENGVVKVVAPIDETPASRAGIKSGDYITHLDGEAVLGLTLSQAVDKMRGPINSNITLTISRRGADRAFDVTITRDVIQVRSVRGRVENKALYLRITSFNEKTENSLKRAVDRLTSELGSDYMGVVLDLRNNPGGLLDQAIAVSDAFLEQGEIVSTRGRREDDTRRYNARAGDLVKGKPIIVLMNGGSASASEIVAGALQDHRRAIVLGTKSFGKGSVQTIIPLQGQGAVRLTTARYYTPSGRSIQATGIVPDVVVEQSVVSKVEGRKRRSESDLRGHLQAQDNGDQDQKEKKADKEALAEKKDFQLAYALDLLKGIALMNGWNQK